jgi:Domain of unknown function (DUF4410)
LITNYETFDRLTFQFPLLFLRGHVCHKDRRRRFQHPHRLERCQGLRRQERRAHGDQLWRRRERAQGHFRPFCIDTAVFKGDEAASDGEMPIRKALTPIEFAGDLKEQLELLAPARILKDGETPRTGWLVEGEFTMVDGGSPTGRFFLGTFGVGRSFLALHVKVTDVDKGITVYEFDMAGGSHNQGRHGTLRASGLGRATPFDLVNAAERIYLVLEPNAFRYGARGNVALH